MISLIYLMNKATRSPEISHQQVQKLIPQFCLYSETPRYGHPSTAVTPALQSIVYGPEWLPFKYMLR